MVFDAKINRTVLLKSRPQGEAGLDNFEIKESSLPEIGSGEFLYRTSFLSVDPYLRGRMNAGKSYIAPFEIGGPIVSALVGEVVRSENPKFRPGMHVSGMGSWSEYGLTDGSGFTLIEKGLPISTVLGVLGMPGLTAFVGLVDIGRPKAGETVVISAASGAVGAVAVQLAKLRGCRTIGIAGGEKKCAYVVKELGADACIDYRRENLRDALKRHCPKGIDVYFENVGGETFSAVLENLADYARIPLCGLISEYNVKEAPAGPSLRSVLAHKAMIQGFIAVDHWHRLPVFHAEVAPLLKAGKFRHREDIAEGLDNAPDALLRVLKGLNFGKQLVRLSPP